MGIQLLYELRKPKTVRQKFHEEIPHVANISFIPVLISWGSANKNPGSSYCGVEIVRILKFRC